MIDDGMMGYVIGGLGLAAAVGQMAWSKFFSTEGKAHEMLIAQLGERITAQESRLTTLEVGLDEERHRRREAEDKVHVLELYVVALQGELSKHGIKVPGPSPLTPMGLTRKLAPDEH